MGGLGNSIGSSISGLFQGVYQAIGDAVRGAFGALQTALPGPLLFVVGFVILAGAAWMLAKR